MEGVIINFAVFLLGQFHSAQYMSCVINNILCKLEMNEQISIRKLRKHIGRHNRSSHTAVENLKFKKKVTKD